MKSFVDFKDLELYRDFKISLSNVNKSGKMQLYNSKTADGRKVSVCIEHVINALNKYKKKEITQLNLIEWIYAINNSALFENCKEYDESILHVFAEIEETAIGNYTDSAQGFNVTHTDIYNILDGNIQEEISKIKKITDVDIDRYIDALQNNIEL